MTRPSQNTDRLLVATARAMVQETGVSGLKLREVAQRAGVNLGMFHYHFKTKDAFLRRVLQEIYEDFFARLSLESSGDGNPLERLRKALLVMGRFARDNRRLFMLLLGDAIKGDRLTLDFARANIPRHAAVLLELIIECQKLGRIRPVPLPVAMSFLVGGVTVPNAIVTLVEHAGAKRPFGMKPARVKELFLSDQALKLRVDLVLTGLKP